jgi:hypothetical protein
VEAIPCRLHDGWHFFQLLSIHKLCGQKVQRGKHLCVFFGVSLLQRAGSTLPTSSRMADECGQF